MKPAILGIVIVLSLISAGAIFYASAAFNPVPTAPIEQLYSNGVYGISFSYPEGYLLSEQSDEDAYRITLIHKEDAVPVVGGGEGPRAITLEIYPHTPGLDLTGWLRSTPQSNVSLGSGEITSFDLYGTPAAEYSWSGLYEGRTIAFLHEERVYVVSVTYNSPQDPIVGAYVSLLSSLRVR